MKPYIKSTTVYGDSPDPLRASVLFALHPVSGRWWSKVDDGMGFGEWRHSGPPFGHHARVHRQYKPRLARSAQLPRDDRRSPQGVKDIPFRGSGELYCRRQQHGGRLVENVVQSLGPSILRGYADQPDWPVALQSHHNCRCAVDLVPTRFTPTVPLEYKEDPMTTSSARATAVASKARVPADAFTVGVRFGGNSCVYHYLTQDRMIVQGDTLVVHSPRSGRLETVDVVSVGDTAEGVQHAHEWIVSRVDPSAIAAYQARKDQEKALALLDQKIERQARVAQGQLDQRLLAQFDPELQRLIAERDAVTNPPAKPYTGTITLAQAAEMSKGFRPRW